MAPFAPDASAEDQAGETNGGDGALTARDTDRLLATALQGADRVVVGTVETVSAAFKDNEHGDRLIISTVSLRVHDAPRGEASPTVSFELEGGTVGDLTLDVSDLPTLVPGDRGVFALRQSRAGASWVPHGRGRGILRLDAQDRVTGGEAAGMTLERVRDAARGQR